MSDVSAKDFLFCLFRYLVALYFVALFNDIADQRAQNLPRNSVILPDLLHDLLSPDEDAKYLCDFITLLLYFCFLAVISTKKRWLHFLCEFIALHTVLLVLRCFLVAITTLPSPVQSCNMHKPAEFSLLNPIKRLLLPSVLSSWCNDLIYSGHTVIYVLVSLFVIDLSENSFVVAFVCILSAVGVGGLLVARLHYSVDIFLAAIITFLLYKIRMQKHTDYGSEVHAI
jgi:lysylphosphatidylglycerol synthetase-like protein (DUF2156 family)